VIFRIKPIKLLAAGALAAFLGWGTSAQAATCGITGSATAQPAIYDPFNPQAFSSTTITLNLTRINGSGGQKTARVNFFLKGHDTTSDGTQIIPTSIVVVGSATGFGLNIFYNYNAAPPTLQPTASVTPSGANRFFQIDFTGNNAASDTAQVTFTVNLPAQLNLNTQTSLPFDAVFSCTTTGGGAPTDQTGQITNAVVFPITILSALQASFVGTALDFGEIGTVTNALASGSNTGTGNYVRVQSSGVYTVELKSQNAFRLKHPTGSLANAPERIDYKLKAFGQFYDNASTPALNGVAFTKSCSRAGIGAANEDRIYLQGTLEEGGAGKTPSLGGNYSDILTVTITPQDIGASSPNDCNAQGAL